MANISVPSMQDLLGAGVHFGHKVSRSHPKMKPYIFGARDGVDIIDLEKSEKALKEAVEQAYKLGKEGKILLIVGTKKQAQGIVEEEAKAAEAPYLTQRWVGGLLTNFDEIKKNVKKLVTLKEEQTKGGLSHYTKKERLLISRRIQKFESELGGVADLEKVPDALFIVDPVSDLVAVKECKRVGILMIGISDTNADPNWFDYPIPGNDDGIKSIKILAEAVVKAYAQGKKEAGTLEPSDKSPEPSKKEEKKADKKEAKAEAVEGLDGAVAEEAAVLEELVEKKIVEESDRKV